MTYEWTDLTFQEKRVGNTAIYIFALAVLNPVESVRMALLSGQDPDLAAFGPVGFYLAQHLGGRALFAIGLAWPVAAGTAAWWLGRRRFVRGDLV
jgi:hypothetical protein